MKQNPGTGQSGMGGGNPGSVTPQPQQQPPQASPPPSQHPSDIPTSQHGQMTHQQQQPHNNNNNVPNGHHHPMMPPQSSSVSPQPEMKWSEINNMNASSANNAYMSGMAGPVMAAPHHYSWYSNPHQQSLLT